MEAVRAFFPRRTRCCVVIPAWNEGRRIREQLARMREIAALADILIADGGSDDGTADPAFLEGQGVRALIRVDGRGLSRATVAAVDYALGQGYEGIITIDGNGKDGVEAIPRFLAALDAGFDLVQGSRYLRGGRHRNTPWLRDVGIRLVAAPLIALAGGRWYGDPTNGFRAMSARFLRDPRVLAVRPVFVAFNLQPYLVIRAAQLGFRVKELAVTRVYPGDGSVPTKIVGWRPHLRVFAELLGAVLGRYGPRR